MRDSDANACYTYTYTYTYTYAYTYAYTHAYTHAYAHTHAESGKHIGNSPLLLQSKSTSGARCDVNPDRDRVRLGDLGWLR